MIEVTRDYRENNTEALHARLQAVFGVDYLSMDSSDAGLVFRFEKVFPGHDALLDEELRLHDAKLKTPRQEKAADKGNAHKRLYTADFAVLHAMVGKPNERDDLLHNLIDMLEDFQKQLYEG